MIFWFLFCEAEQQQGRLRLELRTEGRPERSQAGERLEAGRHLHCLVLQHLRGLKARDAWSAPHPSAANRCTRKEVTPLQGVEIERHRKASKGMCYFHVPQHVYYKNMVVRRMMIHCNWYD